MQTRAITKGNEYPQIPPWQSNSFNMKEECFLRIFLCSWQTKYKRIKGPWFNIWHSTDCPLFKGMTVYISVLYYMTCNPLLQTARSCYKDIFSSTFDQLFKAAAEKIQHLQHHFLSSRLYFTSNLSTWKMFIATIIIISKKQNQP